MFSTVANAVRGKEVDSVNYDLYIEANVETISCLVAQYPTSRSNGVSQ